MGGRIRASSLCLFINLGGRYGRWGRALAFRGLCRLSWIVIVNFAY